MHFANLKFALLREKTQRKMRLLQKKFYSEVKNLLNYCSVSNLIFARLPYIHQIIIQQNAKNSRKNQRFG